MKLSRTLLLVAALLVATTTGHAPAKTTHKPHATPATLTAAKGAHGHHDHDHHAHDHDHHGHDHAHDHDDHDHDHDHEHAHEEAARRKAQEVTTKEGAHGHGANDHDHDHDGHDVAHHDHDGHHHDHAHGDGGATKAPSRAHIDRFSPKVWMEALFATALVGAAPVVVLLFVPLGLGNQEAQKPLLRVFLSFAAGGLLGDALLHLLPHSMPSGGHDHHDHSHDHGHDHGHEGHAHSIQDLAVWLYCIAGMMTFLMLEKFVRAQTGGGGDGHGHSHGGHSHGHSHSHGVAAASKTDTSANARKRGVAGKALSDEEPDKSHSVNDDDKSKQPKQIAAAGYLNLAADFTHNFTDGLAIGATFLRGSGWQTTVAMLLHELPHEIGDFAILIQSGFTRREAMLTQLLTAIGAMVGTVIGLLIEGAGDSSSAWISPFTAGGFIYIACASVMPELLEDCSLAQSLKEGVAMCVGIGLMIVIALNE